MELYDIPKEIINEILFKNLSIKDIQSCILSSRIFHVFDNYHKKIISDSKDGWYDCIKKGYTESVKWLYNISLQSGNIIDIYAEYGHAFRHSCLNDHLEISKWLYDLYLQNGDVINVYVYNKQLFTRCHIHKHIFFNSIRNTIKKYFF